MIGITDAEIAEKPESIKRKWQIDEIPNVLAERYASDRIIELVTRRQILLERELWITVLQAQENGADVPEEAIADISERKMILILNQFSREKDRQA